MTTSAAPFYACDLALPPEERALTALTALDGEPKSLAALIEQWLAEDATDDPAEIEAAERELAQLQANLNANRALTGEEPVFPPEA